MQTADRAYAIRSNHPRPVWNHWLVMCAASERKCTDQQMNFFFQFMLKQILYGMFRHDRM